MANTVLELKNVSKAFGKRKVIDNLSLEVKEGEIMDSLDQMVLEKQQQSK